MIQSLWAYRNFIIASIKSELKGRYARSKFGLVWLVLHPLAQATIFALVLSEVLVAKLPGINDKSAYAVYLMAGMAAWNLFAEITNRCMTVFIEYASVLKKISFPRLCLPVIVGGGALLNHLLLLSAIAVVFLYLNHAPGSAWLVLPIGMALIGMLGFGFGLLLGLINVFARDVGQIFGIVLQFWFWLTPVVYMADALPANLRQLIQLNPLTPIVRLYQDALLFNRWPDWHTLMMPAMLGCAAVLVAYSLFRRASAELVDAL